MALIVKDNWQARVGKLSRPYRSSGIDTSKLAMGQQKFRKVAYFTHEMCTLDVCFEPSSHWKVL